ncbi:unnamed protein product [Cuscuta epithymum]|uniref:Protein RER1 n=1 Tax=Cuscuta epithymum TaxID=186058 RepID=A0AAV0C0E3_9ASTE|nr:unnamed protein product [Cuscuta epithymum]
MDIEQMEGSVAGGATVGDSGAAAITPSDEVTRFSIYLSQRYQHLLDQSMPHLLYRWIAFIAIALVYAVRVLLLQGFFMVSYVLGIYILHLLIGFLSPQIDPETEFTNGPTLPTRQSDDFRPFVRRLPEFKLWYSITKAFCIALTLTFFSMFNVPVFWPILLFYWVVFFMLIMRKQILHMIKYKYLPFSFGKQRYDVKRAASSNTVLLL